MKRQTTIPDLPTGNGESIAPSLACPNCGEKIHASAIVDVFNEPPEWTFWGKPGARFKRCEGRGFVHFKVIEGNVATHRLARIRQVELIEVTG